jgi:hypothetical protein
LLARTLSKILNVPFAIADATVLTEAGYVFPVPVGPNNKILLFSSSTSLSGKAFSRL